MASGVDTSVKRSVTVNASLEHAFAVFTEGFDTWWPRSHHIGKSPMRRAILEGKTGGRCYTEQQDGTESDWGRVLEWDPPHRILVAWQITHEWGYQPDVTRASEVEIRFTREAGGATRVDLEHRYFERMGPGADTMRTGVSGSGGWTGLLELFKERAEGAPTTTAAPR
jgi:uncharacterized protein YndB with AHSA1/START domain